MTGLDWAVVGAYLLAMLGLAALVGRGQSSRSDYYLGGNRMGSLALASSTIATQCSTNSLLGAPAFVGFTAGGGLLWLQYELAVPLAMLALMFLMTPVRRQGHISIYAFLESRLGPAARLTASAVFQIFRGVATGVTVYGVALVLTLLIDVSFTQAVLLLMVVTVIYDVLGGMRAVVLSDVIQLLLLSAAVLVSLWLLADASGGFGAFFEQRTDTLRFDWGVKDTGDYGFWPMLIGGFFLYAAYYGCDQSQAQRVLSAQSERETQKVLLYNGLLRFPLVLGYCLLGLGLAAYAQVTPDYISGLPLTADGAPNFNLAFPYYVLDNFAPGLVGLIMVGIFAAAMSSIDSSLNSLSAATVEDFFSRGRDLDERRLFLLSKATTLFWGLFAVVFSFEVEAIAPTVLEAINKIGSMANGPLLALFVIALLLPRAGQTRALLGFAGGLAANAVLWLGFPGVSWLWWNLSGFVVALTLAAGLSLWRPAAAPPAATLRVRASPGFVVLLLAMAVLILLICAGFDRLAA